MRMRIIQALTGAGFRLAARRSTHLSGRRFSLPALSGFRLFDEDYDCIGIETYLAAGDRIERPELEQTLRKGFEAALTAAGLEVEEEDGVLYCYEPEQDAPMPQKTG